MFEWLARQSVWDGNLLWSWALGLAAVAFLLLACLYFGRALREKKMALAIEAAVVRRAVVLTAPTDERGSRRLAFLWEMAIVQGQRWREGRWGETLLPDSERVVLEVCGFQDASKARAFYVFVRLWLPVVLPIVGWIFFGSWRPFGDWVLGVLLIGFVGFGIGWMLPKWYIVKRAKSRQKMAKEELPLFIDLLRLLQGVGLSIDQSLQVIVSEFSTVMPVLVFELRIAVERHARGIPRVQSLSRLLKSFDNEDLASVARLIIQVDQHGGAVQEPLRQFGERLRDQRRMELKEIVGTLTVKMTAVMVLTMLPALLIVTGGAGFLALFRGLAKVAGGL